jgi:predicted porin
VSRAASFLLVCVFGASASAHAQSWVSLSGTIDVAASRVTGSVASRTQLISGANSSSKLVLRGDEDLGGGMHANFWLESGFNADNGTFQEPSTNSQSGGTVPAAAGTQGLTFDRRAFVGLSGTWGAVHMGREESPTYDTFSLKFDLFGVGSGIGLNYTSGINPNQVRMSNAIAYISPKFAGVFANVQHWFGENPSGTSTSKDGSGSGISLTYQGGPMYGVVHYARTQFAAGNAIYRGAAAYYDPGAWKIAFNLNRDEQGTLMQRGFNVGGLVRVGNSEYKATYSGLRTSAAGGNPEGRKVAVGYVYKFSKRTAMYSTLARVFNKHDSALAIGSATTGPNQSSSAFDIGIRHFF